jgi:hopanoid biosynthesis associated protein HpnK
VSAPARRSAIINADDFGLTPGVNRGIVSAFREGVLTSTTMMVNMRFFDEAVELARENDDLPVGIHLTLLWGRPVSNPASVPSLVDREGRFPRSLATLGRRYLLGRLQPEQVRIEFRAQVDKFVRAGLTPTHLDTHKHVHCLPGVLRAMLEVAGEFGIRRIRFPLERERTLEPSKQAPAPPRESWTAAAKRRLIRALCARNRGELDSAGIRTTDDFVGIRYQDCLNSGIFRLILDTLGDGVTEIMCHPGYNDEYLGEYSRVPPHRERELEGLKDPGVRDLVEARSIRLTHYGEL